MADGKRRDPGAQLEELNDQLARFLQHADQLLEDWARFGAQVRASVDGEVTRIGEATAEAGDRAVARAAAQIDKVAVERVERAVADGVVKLRAELDRAGRATAVVAPPPPAPNRAVLGAVVLANILLVVLLAVTFLRGGKPATAPPPVDAGPTAGVPAEVLEACAGLVEAWSEDDAAIVMRAGTDACGSYAAAVTEQLYDHLAAPPPPIDAGVIDAAPPIDAKRKR